MKRLLFLLPLLLTLLIRVLWVQAVPVDPLDPVDARGFHLLATNLLNGHGFAFGWAAPYCPTALRTPGYPVVLAGWYGVMGSQAVRVIFLHLLLEVLSTAGVMRLARQVGQPYKQQARIPLLAGGLYALNGVTPRYAGVLYAELLLLPCLIAALSLTLRLIKSPRYRSAVCTGAAWACAILIKPNLQYLVLGIAVLVFMRGLLTNEKIKRQMYIKSTILFIAVIGIMLLPWIARNQKILGSWRISTAFEENLVRVTAVAILAEKAGQPVEPWTETWEHLYDRFLQDVLGDQAWVFRAEPEDVCAERTAFSPVLTRAARDLLRENRWLYLKVHMRGVLQGLLDPGHRYWYALLTGNPWADTGVVADMGQRMAWSLRQGAVGDALGAFWSQRVRDIPPVAAWIWWTLVTVQAAIRGLAVWGLWRLRSQLWLMLVLGLSVGYSWVLPGPIAYERFFIPAMPIILVLAAFSVGELIQPAYNKPTQINVPVQTDQVT